MGRHKGEVIRKHTSTCVYCGAGINEGKNICSNCAIKIKLFRQIKSKVKEICEREHKYGS